jgi:hypothetical protein
MVRGPLLNAVVRMALSRIPDVRPALRMVLGRISLRQTKLCALVVATLAVSTLAVAPAEAQAAPTWVSGTGDDANPCSQTAPCRTFAGAITKTATDGEINCLDSGGFGVVTITKAITIDCGGALGSMLNAGTNGVVINATSSDIVRLRNLSIEGAGTGLNGVNILAAASVHIENVVINAQSQAGIRDARAGSSKLFISTAVIRSNGGTGVAVAPSSGGAVAALLEDVLSVGNKVGVAVGNGGKLRVNHSVLSGNANAGVQVGSGGKAMLDSSVISKNAIGVQTAAGAEVILESSVVTNNTVSIQRDDATLDPGGVGGRTL